MVRGLIDAGTSAVGAYLWIGQSTQTSWTQFHAAPPHLQREDVLGYIRKLPLWEKHNVRPSGWDQNQPEQCKTELKRHAL
jgi:hypothetical protein